MLQMQTFSRDADVLKAVWQDGGNCDGQFYGVFLLEILASATAS